MHSAVVGFGATGLAGGFDPARRVLTFTTPPLENPGFPVVTKGWLRASHRALDDAQHRNEALPCTTRTRAAQAEEIYKFEISIEPNAYRFRKGNRIRVKIANSDSYITDVL